MAMDLNALRRGFDSLNKGSDSFVPNEGENYVRFLPPWNKLTNFPFKKMGYHDIYGERVLCPKETNNEPCPICDRVRGLFMSKKEENIALGKELRAVQRFFFNVIVRGQESKGVQKFGCGQKITEKIVNIMTVELKKDITDPEHGHDVVVVKRKIGDFPDYSSSYVIFQESPLGNPEWLNQLHDLDREFTCKPYDDLRDIIEKRLGPTVGSGSAYRPQPTVTVPPVVAPVAPPVQPAYVPPVQPAPVAPPVQPVAPVAPVAAPQPAPVAPVAPAPVAPPVQPAPVAPPVAPVPPVAGATQQNLSAEDILGLINT